MTVTPTPEQDRALTAIRDWLDGDQQSFFVGGYAGTGKTTIIRHVIEGLASVRCATPTGKAAAVLGAKLKDTGVEVTTLHSLLYQPVEVTETDLRAAEGEVRALRKAGLPVADAAKRLKTLKDLLEKGGCEFSNNPNPTKRKRVIIVDEASMAGDDIERDLLAFAPKILWVGVRRLLRRGADQRRANEVAVLEAALEFYADPDNYENRGRAQPEGEIDDDCGERARRALGLS